MKKPVNSLHTITLFLILLVSAFPASAQKPEWSQPFQPFRIAGNLYYVGSYDIACYLITTPQGNILINTGLDTTVPMIRSHVEELGFRFADIKILLSSQAHFDHVGGMARVKKMTGAQVMIDEKDSMVMEDGGNSDFLFGGKGTLFTPVKVDRSLHDGDIIALGGMKITFLHHPGHTKGSSSYLVDVRDEQRTYKVLIANMPTILEETNLAGMATYPEVAKDYAFTLNSLKHLHFDIWLCAHASQCYLHEKYKEGSGYHPEAFMDYKAYNDEIADLQKEYINKLKK